jgi:hypothetical protein
MTQATIITIPSAPPTPATHGALLLTRFERMAPIPVIPYCATATAGDIAATRAAIELATDIYASHIGRLMDGLNENLPMTDTVDAADFMCGLDDLKSDLSGALLRAAGKRETA